ncbi:outer membrane protein [Hydrocarboniphaga sp.]|uniref:outer membrane protein n=1 Tax=Hydrocarboniphaga sp. TaxID=2033016 RepID=UPI003D0B0EC9
MMKATKKLLLLAALAVPTTVFANEGAHVDGYYIPTSKLDVDLGGGVSGDDDGDGFGVKGIVPFGRAQNFFLEGEYQSSSYDDFDVDLDQLRLGGGWQIPLQTGTLAIYGEYVDLQIDDVDADLSGFGVHARLAFPIARNVQIYGQGGYLSLDDHGTYDGFEFLVGASLDITPNIGAFVDYRHTDLSGDVDYTLGDLRVGVRVLFDTSRM